MILFCGCLHSFLALLLIVILKSNHLQYKSGKVRKGRSKVAVLYGLCLVCIVNTIRIQLLKSESIILSTHYNKIEFWTLPISSRRSSKHRWNLHHLLPHPGQSPQNTPEIRFGKGYFFLELFYLLVAWLFIKRINQKRNSLFPNRI